MELPQEPHVDELNPSTHDEQSHAALKALGVTLLVVFLLGPTPTQSSAMATGAPRCNVAATDAPEPRHPYLDRDAVDALDAVGRPAYGYEDFGYGSYPYVYTLYVPRGLPDRPVPLLVTMHGGGGSADAYMNRTGWTKVADRMGFVLAFISGPRAWWPAEDGFDSEFVRDVVADIRSQRCIDARRIWASGHSFGAIMGQRLACDSGDLFAAVALLAGNGVDTFAIGGPCRLDGPGYEPVPVSFWHGDADSLNDYEIAGRRTLREWLARYRCDTVPASSAPKARFGPIEAYGNCHRPDIRERERASGVRFMVGFRTLAKHDHGYPDGCGGGVGSPRECDAPGRTFPTAQDLNAELYDFLRQHARRNPAASQGVPSLDDERPAKPDRTAAWIVGNGKWSEQPRTELGLVDGRGRAISTASALSGPGTRRTIHVEYRVYGGGQDSIEDNHPRCPRSSPNGDELRYTERVVKLRITDARGTLAYAAKTVARRRTGLPVASFTIPAPRKGRVVVEAVTEADTFGWSLLCTAREARFQQTTTS